MTDTKMTTAERSDQYRQVLLVRHFEEGEEKLIRVPLQGKNGLGKYMILDAAVWRDGRENQGWPPDWIVVNEPKSGRQYVETCQRPVGSFHKPMPLARLIMNADKGEVVLFKNGNTFDLRKSNLEKLTRAEWGAKLSKPGNLRRNVFVEVEDTTPHSVDDPRVPW